MNRPLDRVIPITQRQYSAVFLIHSERRESDKVADVKVTDFNNYEDSQPRREPRATNQWTDFYEILHDLKIVIFNILRVAITKGTNEETREVCIEMLQSGRHILNLFVSMVTISKQSYVFFKRLPRLLLT